MIKTSDSGKISDHLRTANGRLIGIDGINGVGKTTLSIKLAAELGCTHINLDDYVVKNRGTFVEHIKYDELRSVIHTAHAPVIIEGICLLAVLEKLQRKVDILVYVRRISEFGLWRDETKCDIVGNVDELLSYEKDTHRKFCEAEAHIEGKDFDPKACDIPPLVEEVIRYHHRFAPYGQADMIYDRIYK